MPARLLGAIAISTLLAACSGGSSVVPNNVSPSSVGESQNVHAAQSIERAPEAAPEDDAKSGCPTTGKGIRIAPCTVTFNLLQFTPQTITATTKAKSVGETDNCASQGIATISGSDKSWTVSDGLFPGTCTAVFTITNGKHHGKSTATLTVSHTLL